MLNIEYILVTLETSHLLMSLLKLDALRNIRDISVTPETFHVLMSSLNEVQSSKILCIFVTFETSHVPMGHPYVVAMPSASSGCFSQSMYKTTASLSSSLD